ncbi:MAG: Rrf2 family transcriptional regulator [SAR324 cluster bacterium]|nr:Rrf2 family transcriptional regulator [SAR324 cluster bacterium]
MLKISKKADYALVALSHLQTTTKPVSAKEIAGAYDLSAQMLANVLKCLANEGFVASTRGSLGGYSLAKHPGEISVGEVIMVFEAGSGFSDCSSKEKECNAAPNCPAMKPMLMINKKIKGFMDSLSLADIAQHQNIKGFTLEGIK